MVQRIPLQEVASIFNVIASMLTLPDFMMMMRIQDCTIAQVNVSTRMVLVHSNFVPFGRPVRAVKARSSGVQKFAYTVSVGILL
jgi:hypothetical protein